jgi:ABC-type branched-subunit amino acid transport system substrate-binding protein
MHRAAIAIWTALLCVVGVLRAAAAAEGISEREIVFGQVAALSGPASALGQGARLGIEAAFAEVNARGGVHGRRLLLVSRDDGYDPDRSLAETRRALEEDKVFALIGAVGTPTSIVTAPLAAAAGVPFIAPITGADLLRDRKLTTTINLRASYAAEARAWVQYLVTERKLSRIAIFYQDDAFGRDALSGLKAALDTRGIDLVAEATFERNTVAVRSALRTLARATPDAVVMVGSYKPCAEFIHQARRTGFNPVFVNISFVGADALADELAATIQPDDMIVCLGAGDITKWAAGLASAIEARR